MVADDLRCGARFRCLEESRWPGRTGWFETGVCARKIRVTLIDDLLYLSPGCIPEDYLLWLDLCAAHGVKLATPDRTFDPGQHNDWVQLLVQAGFDPEDIDDLNRESTEKRRERSLRMKKPLTENPPSPYVYMASLGVLSVDFEQLQQMQELWTLAETHSIPVVAEKLDFRFQSSGAPSQWNGSFFIKAFGWIRKTGN